MVPDYDQTSFGASHDFFGTSEVVESAFGDFSFSSEPVPIESELVPNWLNGDTTSEVVNNDFFHPPDFSYLEEVTNPEFSMPRGSLAYRYLRAAYGGSKKFSRSSKPLGYKSWT